MPSEVLAKLGTIPVGRELHERGDSALLPGFCNRNLNDLERVFARSFGSLRPEQLLIVTQPFSKFKKKLLAWSETGTWEGTAPGKENPGTPAAECLSVFTVI